MTLFLNPAGASPREIADRVNAILQGKINSVGTVTLAVSATLTTVKASVGSNSIVILTPQTAHASAEIGNGTIYIDPANYMNNTSFQVTHASNSQDDRTFGYVVLG